MCACSHESIVAVVILCYYVIQEKYNENQELFTNVVGFKEAIISCKRMSSVSHVNIFPT